MNIAEYIQTGILENYVLGLTTPDENREIEKLVSQHPEIRSEIESIEHALEEYARVYSVEPPSYLKKKILASVKGADIRQQAKVIELYPKQSRYWSFAAVAAILVAVTLGILLVSQKRRNSDLEKQIAGMSKSNLSYIAMLDSLTHVYNQSTQELAVLMSKENRMVCMMGVGKNINALAHVFWNKDKKEVFLEVNNLPQPSDTMQYQLWAIKDGKPVSAGLVSMLPDSVTVQKMENVSEVQQFAITLEKSGGSDSPKGEMYVLGKI